MTVVLFFDALLADAGVALVALAVGLAGIEAHGRGLHFITIAPYVGQSAAFQRGCATCAGGVVGYIRNGCTDMVQAGCILAGSLAGDGVETFRW